MLTAIANLKHGITKDKSGLEGIIADCKPKPLAIGLQKIKDKRKKIKVD